MYSLSFSNMCVTLQIVIPFNVSCVIEHIRPVSCCLNIKIHSTVGMDPQTTPLVGIKTVIDMATQLANSSDHGLVDR